MIITVTLNPALDRIVQLENFKPGKLNRTDYTTIKAGGKGINVARVVKNLGKDVIAMCLLGGYTGNWIKEILKKEEVPLDITDIKSPTRENIKIVDKKARRETEINSTTCVSVEEYRNFKKSLIKLLPEAELLIMAGSVPSGIANNIYRQLLSLAGEYNVKTILDTSGVLLKEALAGEKLPFLIKPNIHELKELLDYNIDSMDDIIKATSMLLNRGLKNVVVSLGSEGALFINSNKRLLIQPPEIEIGSTTVGAGDAMVGGLVKGILEGLSFEEMARYSAAVATSYVKTGDITEKNIIKMLNRIKLSVI